MADSTPPASAALDPAERGARLGARVAAGVFLVFSSWFVLSSTWQLASAALGLGAGSPGSGGAVLDPKGACAVGIRRLDRSIELGFQAAAVGPNPEAAKSAFDANLAPGWMSAESTKAACAREAGGTDAFAKLERLRWTAETVMKGQTVELTQARADVAAVLGR
jgi:hypothetical protein